MKKIQHLETILRFINTSKKCNADRALKCMQSLNAAADLENCQVYIWILERRFSNDYKKREYR